VVLFRSFLILEAAVGNNSPGVATFLTICYASALALVARLAREIVPLVIFSAVTSFLFFFG
jgi:hypothetical protein